jgi:hypothetical protein
MKIPIFIEAKTENQGNQRIPKVIIQTYKSDDIHPFIVNNINNMLDKNPEYNYNLITDEEAEKLIQRNFDIFVYNAYKKLNLGAAKGDFIRYIALYVYGGIYLDLDSSIDCDLNSFIPPDKDFVFLYDYDKNMIQWMFMTTAKNKILYYVILEMIKRIERGERNIFLATGPALFTDVLFFYLKNTYTTEKNIFIPKNLREETFIENKNIDNGLILNQDDYPGYFIEKMENYSNEMLYDGDKNTKYLETYYSPTPNLYKMDISK